MDENMIIESKLYKKKTNLHRKHYHALYDSKVLEGDVRSGETIQSSQAYTLPELQLEPFSQLLK